MSINYRAVLDKVLASKDCINDFGLVCASIHLAGHQHVAGNTCHLRINDRYSRHSHAMHVLLLYITFVLFYYLVMLPKSWSAGISLGGVPYASTISLSDSIGIVL